MYIWKIQTNNGVILVGSNSERPDQLGQYLVRGVNTQRVTAIEQLLKENYGLTGRLIGESATPLDLDYVLRKEPYTARFDITVEPTLEGVTQSLPPDGVIF